MDRSDALRGSRTSCPIGSPRPTRRPRILRWHLARRPRQTAAPVSPSRSRISSRPSPRPCSPPRDPATALAVGDEPVVTGEKDAATGTPSAPDSAVVDDAAATLDIPPASDGAAAGGPTPAPSSGMAAGEVAAAVDPAPEPANQPDLAKEPAPTPADAARRRRRCSSRPCTTAARARRRRAASTAPTNGSLAPIDSSAEATQGSPSQPWTPRRTPPRRRSARRRRPHGPTTTAPQPFFRSPPLPGRCRSVGDSEGGHRRTVLHYSGCR